MNENCCRFFERFFVKSQNGAALKFRNFEELVGDGVRVIQSFVFDLRYTTIQVCFKIDPK